MRKHSHNNNIAAQWAGRRQWRHLMDPRKSQRLTDHRQVNLMDPLQVNLTGRLRGRAYGNAGSQCRLMRDKISSVMPSFGCR